MKVAAFAGCRRVSLVFDWRHARETYEGSGHCCGETFEQSFHAVLCDELGCTVGEAFIGSLGR